MHQLKSLQSSLTTTAVRVASLRAKTKKEKKRRIMHVSPLAQVPTKAKRSDHFVRRVRITTPVFQLDQSSLCHSGSVMHNPFNFFYFFVAETFRYTQHLYREGMFHDWEKTLPREETPQETCRVRLWNKKKSEKALSQLDLLLWIVSCLPGKRTVYLGSHRGSTLLLVSGRK